MSGPRFAPLLPVSSPEWMRQALCGGHDGDFWFPEWGGRYAATRKAKEVCGECPVRLECLEWGMREEHGIYGGLNKHERRRLRQRREAT